MVIVSGNEEMEQELYLLLGVICSNCYEEWYAQDNGWVVPNATEEDASKMVAEYLPKLITLGWCVDIHNNILCPKCNGALKS